MYTIMLLRLLILTTSTLLIYMVENTRYLHPNRQWREEREKLIQCIHLQQLELTQRSTAAHERAADIAKVS